MKNNEFDFLYYVYKNGLDGYRKIAQSTNISLGAISKLANKFKEIEALDEKGLTPKGIELLKPYKVDNAIIMAAGMSSRFVPLSLEMPKGLLKVKDEILIERQIKQLHEAGINDITLVLGYKKEMFFYLEKKYNVKIIINPEYNVKNNCETLYLARNILKNTYICSSDDYFTENVFDEYVYTSYYASIHVEEKSDEWYMIKNNKNEIIKVNKFGDDGDIMLGHVYWNHEFSEKFRELLIKHHELGDYDDSLWEQLFTDNIKKLPPMQVKTYPSDVIFEFDSLDELRRFDEKYVKNTPSKIINNICRLFNCSANEITDFKPIKEGLTNTSFIFKLNDKLYVYRHPGDGTENIINRKHEKKSLELAKKLNVDPTFIYMDEKEGWKVSEYVKNVRIPDYHNFEDTKRILKVLRELHEHNLTVDWEFLPWEEALKIEDLLNAKDPSTMRNFLPLKEKIAKLVEAVKGDGIEKRFCHCDTYAPNWMLTDNETILIDWEYSGNADPGCDLGAYIMDAMYEVEETEKFISEYLQENNTPVAMFHHLAYVAIISYYWFVWALYRESCGAVMGESLHNWHTMAEKYSTYLVEKHLK